MYTTSSSSFTHSQLTWRTHVWHDAFKGDMTLVYRIEWQISIIFPSPGIPSLKSQLITCADVAARHSVLPCVAVCCRALYIRYCRFPSSPQTRYSFTQIPADPLHVCCSVLQRVTVCCSVLQWSWIWPSPIRAGNICMWGRHTDTGDFSEILSSHLCGWILVLTKYAFICVYICICVCIYHRHTCHKSFNRHQHTCRILTTTRKKKTDFCPVRVDASYEKICVCMFIYMHMCAYVYIFVYTLLYIYTGMRTLYMIYIYTYKYVYICVHVYVCTCMYVCVCMYIQGYV